MTARGLIENVPGNPIYVYITNLTAKSISLLRFMTCPYASNPNMHHTQKGSGAAHADK